MILTDFKNTPSLFIHTMYTLFQFIPFHISQYCLNTIVKCFLLFKFVTIEISLNQKGKDANSLKMSSILLKSYGIVKAETINFLLRSNVYLTSFCEPFLFMIISSMQWNIKAYDCSALAINSVCLSAVISLSLSPLSLSQRFFSLGLGITYTLLFENITLHNLMESNLMPFVSVVPLFGEYIKQNNLDLDLKQFHELPCTDIWKLTSLDYLDISLNITIEMSLCSYSINI